MNLNNIIILPTYNERKNVRELVPEIFKLYPEISILVVDDNSPDGTVEEVKELQKKFKNLKLLQRKGKEGLGKAYIHAFQEVFKDESANSVIMMDADFSHNPKYIAEMLREIKNYDLVIGSRYIKNGGTKNWELWRRILSFGGNLYCRIILRKGIHDYTTGFNCIKADILKKINFNALEFSGYAFIIGIKYYLLKTGASVKEIPIIFHGREEGESKISNHIISEGILAPLKLLFGK